MPFADIAGCRMHYEDVGQGPALLLGHSYLWDASMWREQVDYFSSDYRCIVPDLWAHGRSGVPAARSLSILQIARDHLQLMDHIGVEAFHLAGLSVGGMWAVEVALQEPARVASLVVMNSFVGAEPPDAQARYLQMIAAADMAGLLPDPIIEAILPLFFADETRTTNSTLVDDFEARLRGIPQETFRAVLQIGRTIFERPDRLAALEHIACPTLFVAGEQDRSRPPSESRQMAEATPGGRLEVIARAGHLSCLEQPAQVNAVLGDFLRETRR